MEIVPPFLSEEICQFCSEISSEQPIYLDIYREADSLIEECFPNVQRKIERDGGRIIYGWKIWIKPSLFIEGEFHSIWESDEGQWVDITPNRNGETNILFLPDSHMLYNDKQVNNIRKNLSTNRLVDDYILLNDTFYHFTNHDEKSFQRVRHFTGVEVNIFEWITDWKSQLERMLNEGKTPGCSCPCGSGLKYKKCHAKELRKKAASIIKHYNAID